MKLVKVAILAVLAVLATTGLLFVMHLLINKDLGSPEEPEPTPIGTVTMPDMEVTIEYGPEKPDRPDDPDPPPEDPPEQDVDPSKVEPYPIGEGAPPFEGGVEVGNGGLPGDGEFMPVVSVAPEYPRIAAQRGIEGYVMVRYTITAAGTTDDVEVVEAMTSEGEETSIFNRAAVRAVERFRFRPRVIDGQAVEVQGVINRIVFELGES